MEVAFEPGRAAPLVHAEIGAYRARCASACRRGKSRGGTFYLCFEPFSSSRLPMMTVPSLRPGPRISQPVRR